MRGQHEVVDALLAYREVEKLRSTYGTGLLQEIGPDGRIHATFNQTVARTGRLSSDAPNLHNIPVRSEQGRVFRTVFVPAPGCELLVADYNQIELRCIAHLAEDPGLVQAFTDEADIHTRTAARVFGVPEDEVTPAQRAKSKMVSLRPGLRDGGLRPRAAAQHLRRGGPGILEAYFVAFPAVKDYMDRTVAEARDRGYTETLFGRRRPIPELQSHNRGIRMAGERQAMNAGIQGLAADIFKVALVRLDEALAAGEAESRAHPPGPRRGHPRRRARRARRHRRADAGGHEGARPTCACRSRSTWRSARPGPPPSRRTETHARTQASQDHHHRRRHPAAVTPRPQTGRPQGRPEERGGDLRRAPAGGQGRAARGGAFAVRPRSVRTVAGAEPGQDAAAARLKEVRRAAPPARPAPRPRPPTAPPSTP